MEDPNSNKNLHVIFLPYFAPSHIIPMADIARLFASRGVSATILTTTNNARIFQSSVDIDVAAGLQISVHALQLPSAQVGLPEGIENFGQCTSTELQHKLHYAIASLQKPMEQFIRETRPDCIFSDMFFPWTVDIADELKIPRILLYPSNSFFHCVSHSLRVHKPQEKVKSESENFLVPDLPDKIEMARSELQNHMKTKSLYGDLIDQIRETEKQSYGIVLTSFAELELDYFNHFKKIVNKKCWNLGPLSHFARRGKNMKENNPSPQTQQQQQHSCLSWLNNHEPKSVLFVCFGSMVCFSDPQLSEIALALESSQHPFIWVVRKQEEEEEDVKEEEEESWLPSGFEERNKNKGLIIRGWAPQLEILDHPAVGGFLNHCGWNSLLEGVTAGLPLISWPLFAEHFYNSKLSTKVLKIGVEIGPRVWNSGFEIRSPMVGKEELEKAIRFLMGGEEEEEAVEMRRRAEEIGAKARKAGEAAGSSYCDLMDLIESLKNCAV